MKLLLKAALRNKKHLPFLIVGFGTMILLTLANSLEISALGVLTNVETFTHMTEGGRAPSLLPSTHLLKTPKDVNPLNWVIDWFSSYFSTFSKLHLLIAILVGVAFFKAVALFSSRYATQLLAIRVSCNLRQQYFEHIQLLPMSFYQKYNIGSLSSRVVGDASQIATSINSILTNYIHAPFTIFLSLFLCFSISWQLACVIFFGLPMIIIPTIFLGRRIKRVSRQLQSHQESFASVLIDFLAGIQTIKIFTMELFSLKKYKEQNDRMALLEGKRAKYGLLVRPVLHAVTTLSLAAIVLFGLYGLKMTVSGLIVFCGLLQMAYEAIKKFAEENANIQKGVVAAERMFEVLDIEPEIKDRQGAIRLKTFRHSIEFDDVWFRYKDKEEWILQGVSFTIQKGETVALVGSTGSGKSTLIHLLPRLYEVERGEIRIDGKPLHAYTQRSLREQISLVSQDPFFFQDTIAANIAFGKDFSQEEIERAAQQAYADEFILSQQGQYGALLSEAGKNLSGGQQQRLAIARALVKNGAILILDEATSSLDALSEQRIMSPLKDLHGKVTQVIIAHRLGILEHVDRIIYLEQGKKLADGTLEELLATCKPFRQAWEILYDK